MAKKGDELVAYVTRRMVEYVTTPREERVMAKQTKPPREPLMTRLFGMLPMALGLMMKPKTTESPSNTGESLGQG